MIILLICISCGQRLNEIQKGPKTNPDVVVNVLAFGAKNNQNSTVAIQNAINEAARKNGSVLIPEGYTFLVNTLILKNGLKKIYGKGVLKGLNILNTGAIIETERNNYLKHCTVSLQLDLSNGAGYGFLGRNIENCSISNNKIYGFTDDLKASRIGIFLSGGSNNNKIYKNTIVGFENPTSKKASIGIYIQGESEPFAGFFDEGNIKKPIKPCYNNVIINNDISFGKVAIDILGSDNIFIKYNSCYKNKTRGIYIANASSRCQVIENNIIGFGSSAVVLGYGSNNNRVINNEIKQIENYNQYAGEAAININTGAYDNLIADNKIHSFTHYGVYLATNMINNVVRKNIISGYYVAAIALENEFQDTPPKKAIYSRPNYGPPIIGNKWASKDTYGNIIEDNIIKDSYKGRQVGSIYVSQLGAEYKTRDNIIRNNKIIHEQKNNIPIMFFEETKGMMINNVLVGNKIKDARSDKILLSRGKMHFKTIKNNDGID